MALGVVVRFPQSMEYRHWAPRWDSHTPDPNGAELSLPLSLLSQLDCTLILT